MGHEAKAEMGNVLGKPWGPASSAVRRYEAHSFTGLAPGFHRGLPSRSLTFRFSIGEPTEITGMPDPVQPPGTYFAFVGGLHSLPARVEHAGRGCGIGIDVSPLAARRLFGLPAGPLGSVVVQLGELLGASVTSELCDRLHAHEAWTERFAVLDDILGRIVNARTDVPLPRPEVVKAWRCIVESRGTTTVEALARYVGWSRRHLSSQFRAEIGISPKAAIRILRFETACTLLLSDGDQSLAAVAAATGFYDQSHLTREWRDLAGCSPTEWLSEEFHDPPRDPGVT